LDSQVQATLEQGSTLDHFRWAVADIGFAKEPLPQQPEGAAHAAATGAADHTGRCATDTAFGSRYERGKRLLALLQFGEFHDRHLPEAQTPGLDCPDAWAYNVIGRHRKVSSRSGKAVSVHALTALRCSVSAQLAGWRLVHFRRSRCWSAFFSRSTSSLGSDTTARTSFSNGEPLVASVLRFPTCRPPVCRSDPVPRHV